MPTRTPTSIELKLAARFIVLVAEQLDPADLAEVRRRNMQPRYKGCCATHDFCDANMIMDQAWRDSFGHEINADDEAQAEIWNTAWAIARRTALVQEVA